MHPSTIIRLPSGCSPAQIASSEKGPFRCGPDCDQTCTFRHARQLPSASRRSLSLFTVRLPRPSSAIRGAVRRRRRAPLRFARCGSLSCLRLAAPNANCRTVHRSAHSSTRRPLPCSYASKHKRAWSSPARVLTHSHSYTPAQNQKQHLKPKMTAQHNDTTVPQSGGPLSNHASTSFASRGRIAKF